MVYTAHISATYSLQNGVSNITPKQCWDAVKNSSYTDEIKAYLGSYITYDDFLDNLRFEISDEKITTFYTDDSQVRAKRIVNTVTGKLCNYFVDQNKVVYISKNGKTIAEQVRVVGEPRIKINVLYFTELGILAGWLLGLIIWTIIYVGNGRIKNKSDIEEHLHTVLLAEIPHIKDIV
jgi:capsular polysaccharide biosynthesis protein